MEQGSRNLQSWLDDEVPRLTSRHGVPGASVAVLAEGRVSSAVAGVINLRTGVEVTSDTLFMIQSVTKVWTATLVMQLVDEGLVQLDIPVREYLPQFRTADEGRSARITIRQLLIHTGGFEGDLWAATTSGPDALSRFVADLVADADQFAEPGELYSYCNSGYGVLGRVVEVMRGEPYPSALRRQLAEPLGIDELAFEADEALAFRTAIGHASPTPGVPAQPVPHWAVLPPSNPAAGNQLAMSARALLAFGRLHLEDGRTADGRQLLSAGGARAMRSWQVDHPGATGSHGLGWFLDQPRGLVEHAGDTMGVAALLRLIPEHRIAVAVLTNGGQAGQFMSELVDPLLAGLAGVAGAATPATPPPAARTRRPERYLGRFGSRVSRFDVEAGADARLWLTETQLGEALTMAERAGVVPQPRRNELRPDRGETFRLIDDTGAAFRTIEFLGDDAGRARFLHTGRAHPRRAEARSHAGGFGPA